MKQSIALGSHCRVWNPARLPGLVQWLSADRGITLTSGAVSTWADLSKNANHATQNTGANRPTLTTGAINGHPVVSFTGAQFLNHSLRVQAPCTIAFVAKTTSVAANYAVVASYSGGAGGAFLFAKSDAAQQWGSYTNAAVLSGSSLTTYKRCVAVIRGYNDIDFRTNGVKATVTSGVSAYVVANAIGAGTNTGSQNLEGGIAELVACTGALSDANCRMLEAYFAHRYAL